MRFLSSLGKSQSSGAEYDLCIQTILDSNLSNARCSQLGWECPWVQKGMPFCQELSALTGSACPAPQAKAFPSTFSLRSWPSRPGGGGGESNTKYRAPRSGGGPGWGCFTFGASGRGQDGGGWVCIARCQVLRSLFSDNVICYTQTFWQSIFEK